MFGYKLVIRTSKKEGQVPLFTQMRINNKNCWINLTLMVDIRDWSVVSQSDKKTDKYLDKMGFSKKLFDIENGIKELRRTGNLSKENIERMVQDIVLKEQREDYIKKERLGQQIRERKSKSVRTYITSFVSKMESGELRNKKGELYGEQTIRAWRQFKRVFLDFHTRHPFEWEDVDQSIINSFMTYLEKDCGYMKKTRSKYLKNFKQILSDSEKLGLHKNSVAKNLVVSLTVKESDKAREIFLTKEELERFYDMELEGFEEIVRDVFLIGCYTAQRFGDFSSINESCIGVTAKGVRVIRLEQEKTGNTVVVPIMDERLEILLKKYNYTVPPVTDQAMNRTIKEIGRKLSKTVPSLARKERTLLKKQEKLAEERGDKTFERDTFGYVVKPRWQMISTHTCRRSAITNMYLSGKFTIPQMMSVSGHRDERQFKEYVKLNQDQLAEMVASSGVDGMF